ncbi:hypothetical protein [Xylanimonas ulmi]|uniref:Uncharacterized protein n=1 Tax=Xylanimonas ulmi TaxID=228973 RepID=A0A4Q7M7A3_9MICO|nr:hypothetical protein [Xylanibacterium ulmi]RZS62532.1 hypothetical protein EV386_2868 [Xylanibacterium ulmi]
MAESTRGPNPETSEPAPAPTPAPAPAPTAARGVVVETLPVFLRVPRDVWRGETVAALDHVRASGNRMTWFVVVAGVGVLVGLVALLGVAVAGGSFGMALQAFAVVALAVLGFCVLRCLTVWWALRTRVPGIAFSAASSLVATVVALYGFVVAVAVVLSLLPGDGARAFAAIVVGALLLIATMASEPLLYIGMAREAGRGRSILMPYIWFNLVFGLLLSVVGMLATLVGLAAIWDALT